jgi:hypothetical protein
MDDYEKVVLTDLKEWIDLQRRKPSLAGRATKVVQKGINHIIPEGIHKVVTKAIRQMVKGVLTGSDFITPNPKKDRQTLEEVERKIRGRIKFYRTTAAAEGAVTGAGGFVWGLADFPLWLSLKMKMLFEIAAIHGIDTSDYRERIYILNIFRLTFSNQHRKNIVIDELQHWQKEKDDMPENLNDYDWRTFQLEYRDHIDLAKLLQLIPGVGAFVGFYINHRYTDKLGQNAINCYRLRHFEKHNELQKTKRKGFSFFGKSQESR